MPGKARTRSVTWAWKRSLRPWAPRNRSKANRSGRVRPTTTTGTGVPAGPGARSPTTRSRGSSASESSQNAPLTKVAGSMASIITGRPPTRTSS